MVRTCPVPSYQHYALVTERELADAASLVRDEGHVDIGLTNEERVLGVS